MILTVNWVQFLSAFGPVITVTFMFLSSASCKVKYLLRYLSLKASRVQAAGDACLCEACVLGLASVMASKHGARLRLRLMLFPSKRNLQSVWEADAFEQGDDRDKRGVTYLQANVGCLVGGCCSLIDIPHTSLPAFPQPLLCLLKRRTQTRTLLCDNCSVENKPFGLDHLSS